MKDKVLQSFSIVGSSLLWLGLHPWKNIGVKKYFFALVKYVI
jgi:hypothetical protein